MIIKTIWQVPQGKYKVKFEIKEWRRSHSIGYQEVPVEEVAPDWPGL